LNLSRIHRGRRPPDPILLIWRTRFADPALTFEQFERMIEDASKKR